MLYHVHFMKVLLLHLVRYMICYIVAISQSLRVYGQSLKIYGKRLVNNLFQTDYIFDSNRS